MLSPYIHKWKIGHMRTLTYYTVYGIWDHMHNSVTYPILRHTLSYTHHQMYTLSLVSPRDTWRSSAFTNTLAQVLCSFVLQGVCLCYTMVYKLIFHK